MTIEELREFIELHEGKTVSMPWRNVLSTFTSWYYSNPVIFGSGFIPWNRDCPRAAHLVMEDAAKAWAYNNGYSFLCDHLKQEVLFFKPIKP